jgi:hypothetical protein
VDPGGNLFVVGRTEPVSMRASMRGRRVPTGHIRVSSSSWMENLCGQNLQNRSPRRAGEPGLVRQRVGAGRKGDHLEVIRVCFKSHRVASTAGSAAIFRRLLETENPSHGWGMGCRCGECAAWRKKTKKKPSSARLMDF